MLKILHRIVCMTGKYSSRIRASYLTSFIKGIMMKAPLIFRFFCNQSIPLHFYRKTLVLSFVVPIAGHTNLTDVKCH